jgi:hypothetical protein
MMDPRPSVTCGIDWAEGHYDVAVVDADGGLVGKSRFADTSEGFGAFIELLATAGDTENDPIPVAIETPRGLLVSALRATGRQVYSINPMAVARYRERWTVARSKSDHADAMVLANLLRTDIHAHRRCPATANWPARSRSLPAPIRTPPGDAREHPTSCGRCYGSTTRASCTPSPPEVPPTSLAETLG